VADVVDVSDPEGGRMSAQDRADGYSHQAEGSTSPERATMYALMAIEARLEQIARQLASRYFV
jgi:hypothetical protein